MAQILSELIELVNVMWDDGGGGREERDVTAFLCPQNHYWPRDVLSDFRCAARWGELSLPARTSLCVQLSAHVQK